MFRMMWTFRKKYFVRTPRDNSSQIQYIPDLGWVLTRSSYKIFFSESSHHPEHFSYLSFCFKMNTSEATGDWNLLKKRDFKLKFVQNVYFRVSGIDSKGEAPRKHWYFDLYQEMNSLKMDGGGQNIEKKKEKNLVEVRCGAKKR